MQLLQLISEYAFGTPMKSNKNLYIMNRKNRVALLIQILILAIPFFFWKHIRNVEIKFSLTLFIVIFYGYAFFRIFESYLQQQIQPEKDNEVKDRYVWFGIILQVFLLIMFYQNSKRLLEIVKS